MLIAFERTMFLGNAPKIVHPREENVKDGKRALEINLAKLRFGRADAYNVSAVNDVS